MNVLAFSGFKTAVLVKIWLLLIVLIWVFFAQLVSGNGPVPPPSSGGAPQQNASLADQSQGGETRMVPSVQRLFDAAILQITVKGDSRTVTEKPIQDDSGREAYNIYRVI